MQENPLSSRSIHEGRVVRLSLDTVCFPDGSIGELEFIRHRGASAILPFLDPPEAPDPRVVLIHQFRYAAGGRIYEVPAGIPISQEESWEACARRELLEETGYEAGELRFLTRILTTPGFTNEEIHLFAAEGLRAGAQQPDIDEFIEVVPVPFSRAIEMVRQGEIIDGKSVVSLLYAACFRNEGRSAGG